MRRARLIASSALVAFLSNSMAMGQVPPAQRPELNASEAARVESPPATALAPATRWVVFTPDRPDAQLEFRGVALPDGTWKKEWIPVCIGPCAGPVPLGQPYRVGGPGLDKSRHFEIGPGATPLHLEAKTGSSLVRGLGIGATVLGSIAVPVGLFLAATANPCDDHTDPADPCDKHDTGTTVGLLTAGLGVATLVTGIVLLVRSQTDVTIDEPRDAPR